jgi:recombination protein RecR
MSYYPTSILNLIKSIAKLPGIGEKTAERLALHLLHAPRKDVEELARGILDIKEKVRLCSRCYGLSDGDLCRICSNPGRDAGLVCVVEQPADMVAVEKSGAFQGTYHILNGVLSPIDKVGPGDIRIAELMSRVSQGTVKEVVLATGTNVEGESTAAYIAQQLEKFAVKTTRIASGVPMGGDLKYVDQVTLKKAMEARHAVR